MINDQGLITGRFLIYQCSWNMGNLGINEASRPETKKRRGWKYLDRPRPGKMLITEGISKPRLSY